MTGQALSADGGLVMHGANNLPATRLTRRPFRDSPPSGSGISPIVPAESEAHSGLSRAGDRRSVRGEAPNEDCGALAFQPVLRVARPRCTGSRSAALLAGHRSVSLTIEIP